MNNTILKKWSILISTQCDSGLLCFAEQYTKELKVTWQWRHWSMCLDGSRWAQVCVEPSCFRRRNASHRIMKVRWTNRSWVNVDARQAIIAFTLSRKEETEIQLATARQTRIQMRVLFVCCYFYAIATVFQLYHGGDMMHEMRRWKPEPTFLLTQGTFNTI